MRCLLTGSTHRLFSKLNNVLVTWPINESVDQLLTESNKYLVKKALT